jgi:MFS family permease
LLFVFFGLFMMTIGFVLPVWVDWVAGVFRKEKRGTAFGLASFGSAMAGALSAVVAGRVLKVVEFPVGHAVLFLIGTVFFFVSMLAYLPLKELKKVELKPRLSAGELLNRFRISLSDTNFRRYLLSRLFLTAGSGPVVFFAMRFKSAEGGAVPAETIVTLGAALTLSQAVAAVLLGRIGDRFGHKTGAVIVSAAQICALFVAFEFTGAWACGAAFALTGVSVAGAWVSHQNLLFETCPHDCRVAHITVSNLVLAPLTAMVPVLTGKIVALYGTGTAIGICLVPTVLGLGWLVAAVKEPRTIPVRTEG